MHRSALFFVIVAVVVVLPLNSSSAQTLQAAQPVEIIRDTWGIAHVYSGDEWSLFYGAGYAAAQDRLLQMSLVRWSMQGRLAEFFGSRYLAQDKRLRTIGLYRHATSTLPLMNDTARSFLEAYAEGVNAYMRDNPQHLSALFQNLGGTPEPWSAADCIAAFHRIAEYFDRGWTSEVQGLRAFEPLADSLGREAAIALLEAQRRLVDDEAAVVSKEEYDRYPKLFAKLEQGTASFGKGSDPSPLAADPWEPPKMSHDWVVHGSRSTTGLPILESDPQISVEAPSTWYECHLAGGRFNVRGIGLPGSPGMLIGFSERCAWGLTALGSDNADLFQEIANPANPLQYEWQGGWENAVQRTETIRVKGAQDVTLVVTETRHGPIVDEFVPGRKADEHFALHWMVTQQPGTSLEALLRMMRATDWPSFSAGMELYVSPGTHLIYADAGNTIAYRAMARLPLRAHDAGIPYRGWTGDEEWKGLIPFKEMPRMLNPIAGFISTANNAPVGSWYPYAIGGGLGDNSRSWRLRELFSNQQAFSVDNFFDIHRDATDPIVRDFVRFGLMAVDEEQPTDPNVLAAAALLRGWDYRIVTTSPTYPYTSIAGTVIKRSLRNTPLESRYFGSDAGLVQLFRDVEAYFRTNSALIPDQDIRNWLLAQLGAVYRSSGLPGTGRPVTVTHKMLYQNNLEVFGSLDARSDMTSPPLMDGVASTIWSQSGNSYSQLVDFSMLDSSWSVLPPGVSEVPASAHFKDQIPLWVDGAMHLAPLSRGAVQRLQESTLTLNPVTDALFGDAVAPPRFALSGSFPNPFSGSTSILFSLAASSIITLEIVDLYGREIRVLRNGSMDAGRHLQLWDGRDTGGVEVPSGVYFIRFSTPEERAVRAVNLLR